MLRQSFSKAGRKEEGLSRLELDDAIGRERPDLQYRITYFPEQGKCAFVLVHENEIFKGPSKEDQIKFIEQECAILQHLEGRGLKVPVVTTVGQDAVFFGMTKIDGLSTSRNWVEMMGQTDKQALAHDIALFMHGLAKAFSPEDEARLLQHQVNTTPDAQKIIAAIKNPAVQNCLNGNLYDCCTYIEQYVKRLEETAEIVFHNDLHAGNIILDPDTNKMTGIVDFGYVSKGVPELGFLSLCWAFPTDFVKKVCEEYTAVSGQKVEYRDILLLRLSLGTQALATAIHQQAEKDVLSYRSDITANLKELKDIDKKAAPDLPLSSGPKNRL